MSVDDLNGGAAAPAETTTTETSTDARSAIDRAFDSVFDASETGAAPAEAGEQQQTTDTTAATTTERERNPDGTFKGKDAAAATTTDPAAATTATAPDMGEAPAGFDPEAKAAWGQTPDPVKGAVTRRLRELESGLERYRGDAQTYNNVFKPFVDIAQRANADPAATLRTYVQIDDALARDFDTGISLIFQRAGIDPRQWAAAVAGQPPQAGQQQPGAADPRDKTITELRQQISRLERGVGGITQTLAEQQTNALNNQLSGYVATLSDGDKTLFKELDGEIAAILQSDQQITLTDAFAKAKADAQARFQRIFGAAPSNGAAPLPTTTATTTATAQTRTAGTSGSDPRKGQLSVTGAPGRGQSTTTKAVPPSARAAIDDAFATLGLG